MDTIESHDWSDLGDLKQYESPAIVPLATIAYSDEYKMGTTLLHALMERGEKSKRALDLTGAVIEMNPAHYTVWDYRLDILKAIGKDPKVIAPESRMVQSVDLNDPTTIVEDDAWINGITLDSAKNYQCWNYRQHLEVAGNEEYYNGELLTIKCVLKDDSKNFHAWSHLKWLTSSMLKNVPSFAVAGSAQANDMLRLTEQFLEQDVRNNSAWNYRHYLYTALADKAQAMRHENASAAFQAELEFVQRQINLAPQNESAWNYIRGLYASFRPAKAITEMESFCLQHKPRENTAVLEDVKSTFAMELLLEIYKLDGRDAQVQEQLRLLDTISPTRKALWHFLAQ